VPSADAAIAALPHYALPTLKKQAKEQKNVSLENAVYLQSIWIEKGREKVDAVGVGRIHINNKWAFLCNKNYEWKYSNNLGN